MAMKRHLVEREITNRKVHLTVRLVNYIFYFFFLNMM